MKNLLRAGGEDVGPTRYRLGSTWIEPEELAYSSPTGAPSGSQRRGLVRFARDGRLRIVRLGVADTYFSIPARPAHGRIGTVQVGEFNGCEEFIFYEFPYFTSVEAGEGGL